MVINSDKNSFSIFNYYKPILVLVIFISLGLTFKEFIDKQMILITDTFNHNLLIGCIIFSAVFFIAVLMGIHSLTLEIYLGYTLSNYYISFTIIYIVKLSATILSFLIGRYLFKEQIQNSLKDYKLFSKLNTVFKSPQITILLFYFRLLPIPEFVKNYGLSVSKCPFTPFVFATMMSEFLMTIGAVLFGHYFKGNQSQGLYQNGLICVLILGIYYLTVCVFVKDKFEQILDEKRNLDKDLSETASLIKSHANSSDYEKKYIL